MHSNLLHETSLQLYDDSFSLTLPIISLHIHHIKKYKFERSTRSSDSRFIKYNAHTHMSTHTNGKNSVFALPRSGPKAQDDERDQALASAAELRITSCESNRLVFGLRLVPRFHSMHLDLIERTGDKSGTLYTFRSRYFYLGLSRNNNWVFICCE